MKFDKGNYVEIINNTCYHNFKIGDIVEITEINTSSSYYEGIDEFGSIWCFTDEDCQALKGVMQ